MDVKDHPRNLRHSYRAEPLETDEDWALKRLDVDWSDGGAYALLGPSGCGKTTCFNIISGLLHADRGPGPVRRSTDVTGIRPDERNIAQVFQFPVVYDTMTRLRQPGVSPAQSRRFAKPRSTAKVREIADMLDLSDALSASAPRA